MALPDRAFAELWVSMWTLDLGMRLILGGVEIDVDYVNNVGLRGAVRHVESVVTK